MFDYIEGNTNCINCNEEIWYSEQTKDFECLLSTYSFGSVFPRFGTGFDIYSSIEINCPNCKHTAKYGMVTVNDVFTHVVHEDIGKKINDELNDSKTVTITFSNNDLIFNTEFCRSYLEKIKEQLLISPQDSYDATDFKSKIDSIIISSKTNQQK